tara:strand:+ start:239 stop:1084 length:846 start_codon:yes stop_codon:yes gene_type:complete
MQIFENKKHGRDLRSRSLCSYCRESGHNISECPQVAKDYAYWSNFKVPPHDTSHWRNRRQPKYWGEWYTKCVEAYHKQVEKQKQDKLPKKKRIVQDKKCGFCGGGLHNRRNCQKMAAFLRDANTANEKWRRNAYHLLVNQLGISVGAAIKVSKKQGWGANETKTEHIALISAVNWDELNLTCANETWEDRYRQYLRIEVVVDGQRHVLKFSAAQTENMKSIFRHINCWGTYSYVDKIAPAPKPLDESWVSGYKDAFEFIAKKRSFEQLEQNGIAQVVEQWK